MLQFMGSQRVAPKQLTLSLLSLFSETKQVSIKQNVVDVYNRVLFRYKLLIHATRWMSLENNRTLSERSQTQKNTV